MYAENNSSEDILKRMKDDITSDIDKSEGSFVYDALAPASKEFEKAYRENDDILNRTNPYTATGSDLEKITNPVGVYRKDGGKATTQILLNGVIGTTLKAGAMVQTKAGLIYTIANDTILTSNLAFVDIIASEIGSSYNVPANTITELPVQISGVISITNPNPVTNGYDIEDDESLRQRYFERLKTPATSGNKYHYRNWAKEVIGVGDAKVFPLWNGNGTVKVIIINSNKKAADANLITQVFNHIEENRPVGATVTVVSAIEKSINTSAKLILAGGFNIRDVQEKFNKLLDKDLKETAFKLTYISIAKIGGILLNTAGVLDYADLKINNLISNIGLQDEEIPVLGTTELGV